MSFLNKYLLVPISAWVLRLIKDIRNITRSAYKETENAPLDGRQPEELFPTYDLRKSAWT